MRYLHFIIKSTMRNKRRLALMALSSGFSLFLLLALNTFLNYLLNPPRARQSELRMAVTPVTSMLEGIPLAYLAKIEAMPHISAATPFQFFMSQWKGESRNMIRSLAMVPERFWKVFPDLQVTPGTREKMAENRMGAIAGDELMKQYGWEIGQRITLKGMMQPVDVEVEIVGSYHWSSRSNAMFFNYDYLNEMLGRTDRPSMLWITADSAESVDEISESIRSEFSNSNAPVKAEVERTFFLNQISRLGNIQALLGAVAVVVTFTMLLVTGSNMAMSLRERMREIGVLKAIGYRWQLLLGIMLGEAAFTAILSGLVAAALTFAMGWFPFGRMTGGILESLHPSAARYAMMFGVGIGLALASALPSAVWASRVTITQALRRVE